VAAEGAAPAADGAEPVAWLQRRFAAGAELVHASGNLQSRFDFARGDAAAAFASAAHIVEAVYETPRQMHGFMETEGGYALVAADGTVYKGPPIRAYR